MHTADNRIFLKFCCIINTTAYIRLNWFIARACVSHLNIFEYRQKKKECPPLYVTEASQSRAGVRFNISVISTLLYREHENTVNSN